VCLFIHISCTVVYCQDFWSSTVSVRWTGHTAYGPTTTFLLHITAFLKKSRTRDISVFFQLHIPIVQWFWMTFYPFPISILCVVHCSIGIILTFPFQWWNKPCCCVCMLTCFQLLPFLWQIGRNLPVSYNCTIDPGISGEPNVSYCYTVNSNCPDIQYGATDLHGPQHR
jgi:hypothetical protein